MELKDDVYLVKWICNDELVGEYELGSGNWGAYPLSLGHWRFEFHREGFGVEHYNHNLEKENDADDQKSTGVSASYTMGSMTLGGASNKVENMANTLGADHKGYEMTLSFAF